MHEEFQTKRAVTEQLSRDLEDPANLIRYILYELHKVHTVVRSNIMSSERNQVLWSTSLEYIVE